MYSNAIALAAFVWAAGPAAGIEWKQVSGTKVPVPPPVHPRLYLRAEHVPDLRSRLQDPVLQPVVDRLKGLARKSGQFGAEWDALNYLAAPDREAGRDGARATIRQALGLLKACELADRQDACRATGRMMVTGAIVYDWLYPLLTADEKKAFIAELVRLAKTQECGYPPTRQGSITGHASEAMIMRDMISAGIAIYDEQPEMYDLAAGRFFREHLPARNWLYDGHAYHQGDSYGPHRYGWDTFPLWIFDRLGAGNVYNPQQRHVPYLYVYTCRPDGQRLRAGDTFCHSTQRGQPWGVGLGAVLTASYYGDGYLLSHHLAQGGVRDGEPIFELLWRDPKLAPLPIADLPRTRYFGPPFGWMVARTGWDEDAVIAEMKVNVYNFNNHQHLDAGAFQLYHKGGLAIDSGLYTGSSGRYGSPHCRNYYWRTIAHNSLLVHDPGETFNPKAGYGNDGGQRLPNNRGEPRTLEVLLDAGNGYRTGEVLAHGFGPDARTPDWSLLKGDITAAYGPKVRQVVRSFVFLNLRDGGVPAALVVFDRVVSADAAFGKYWLLHCQSEPRLEAAAAAIDCTAHGQRGRLVVNALLPEAGNLELTKVGGPGKEYWVFGQNYANDPEEAKRERSSMETGAWRVEISPKAPAAEDILLSVLQVMDHQQGRPLPVRRVDAGDFTGCRIDAPDGPRIVLFRRDAAVENRQLTLRIDDKTGGSKPCRVLITDLAPGPWRAEGPAGAGGTSALTVSPDARAAWLTAAGGEWTIRRLAP